MPVSTSSGGHELEGAGARAVICAAAPGAARQPWRRHRGRVRRTL